MITTSDIIIICLLVALVPVIVLFIEGVISRRNYPSPKLTFYPVVIEQFPTGKQMVLVRSIETHTYGGWYWDIEQAVDRFGEMARKLPIIPSSLMDIEYTRDGFRYVGHCQRKGYKPKAVM